MEETFSLVDHLEELRKRLFIVGLSILLLGVISFLVSDLLIALATAPVLDRVNGLYFFSPFEAFLAKIKISAVSGVIFALPVVFTQLWQFVSPGLYPSERRIVAALTGASTILFFFGALFAYWVVVPIALRFFLDFRSSMLTPLISLGSYLSFFLSFLVAFGVMFDVPVVLIGLIWLKVLRTQFLVGQRKVVVVILFVVAAILTPTADMVTQCLFALPLWLLFELSILIGRRMEKHLQGDQPLSAI
ncbi:MAG: twin-arginine translocase subunit TatC [Candidatus Omnitrophica bacterium]|nr:twin-arginine translocase subunit TatC [Candidatus Omnitrophota bacterium]